jgi:hypothetical protein
MTQFNADPGENGVFKQSFLQQLVSIHFNSAIHMVILGEATRPNIFFTNQATFHLNSLTPPFGHVPNLLSLPLPVLLNPGSFPELDIPAGNLNSIYRLAAYRPGVGEGFEHSAGAVVVNILPLLKTGTVSFNLSFTNPIDQSFFFFTLLVYKTIKKVKLFTNGTLQGVDTEATLIDRLTISDNTRAAADVNGSVTRNGTNFDLAMSIS